MEGVAPPLRLIWHLKKSIDRGSSVRNGLSEYLKNTNDTWSDEVGLWSMKIQQGLETSLLVQKQRSIYRQQLLKIVERGLRGEAIYTQLVQLEFEILEQVDHQIEEFVIRLPYLLLVPLALFLFPSCLILMLGPFILQLIHSF